MRVGDVEERWWMIKISSGLFLHAWPASLLGSHCFYVSCSFMTCNKLLITSL